MPHDRFYAPFPFKLKEIISLEGDEADHLQKVMRKKAGDKVELVNGKGQLAEATLQRSDKKTAFLEILSLQKIEPLTKKLTLALALTLPSHLEFAVEKGTEIGVTTFFLFPADKSERRSLTTNQWQRLAKITIAAMKQSGRGDLPSLLEGPPLKEWPSPTLPLFFGDLSPEPLQGSSPFQNRQEVMFAIGPESGWSEPERALFLQMGGQPFSLHPYILRAETAAIVAATLILNSRT